jgi:hypothetical protein
MAFLPSRHDICNLKRPQFPYPETLPYRIDALITRCWAHDPAMRPAMDEVVEVLQKVVTDGTPVVAEAAEAEVKVPPSEMLLALQGQYAAEKPKRNLNVLRPLRAQLEEQAKIDKEIFTLSATLEAAFVRDDLNTCGKIEPVLKSLKVHVYIIFCRHQCIFYRYIYIYIYIYIYVTD